LAIVEQHSAPIALVAIGPGHHDQPALGLFALMREVVLEQISGGGAVQPGRIGTGGVEHEPILLHVIGAVGDGDIEGALRVEAGSNGQAEEEQEGSHEVYSRNTRWMKEVL